MMLHCNVIHIFSLLKDVSDQVWLYVCCWVCAIDIIEFNAHIKVIDSFDRNLYLRDI